MSSSSNDGKSMPSVSLERITAACIQALLGQWTRRAGIDVPIDRPPPGAVGVARADAGGTLDLFLSACMEPPSADPLQAKRKLEDALKGAVLCAVTTLLRRQGLLPDVVQQMLDAAGSELVDRRHIPGMAQTVASARPLIASGGPCEDLALLLGMQVFAGALAGSLSKILGIGGPRGDRAGVLRMAANLFTAARMAMAERTDAASAVEARQGPPDTAAGNALREVLDDLADRLIYGARQTETRDNPQAGQVPQLEETLRRLLAEGSPSNSLAAAVQAACQVFELQGGTTRAVANLLARVYVGGQVMPDEAELADGAAALGHAIVVNLRIAPRTAQRLLDKLAELRPEFLWNHAVRWLGLATPFKAPADASPDGLEVSLRSGALIQSVLALGGHGLKQLADVERCGAMYVAAQRLLVQAARESQVQTQASKSPAHFEAAAEMLKSFGAIFRKLVPSEPQPAFPKPAPSARPVEKQNQEGEI